MKSKPIKGYENYIVYEDDTPLKSFQSCLEASRYFNAVYGGSLSSMHKYRKVGCFHIKCNDYSQ